jgi:hypothetical protein
MRNPASTPLYNSHRVRAQARDGTKGQYFLGSMFWGGELQRTFVVVALLWFGKSLTRAKASADPEDQEG